MLGSGFISVMLAIINLRMKEKDKKANDASEDDAAADAKLAAAAVEAADTKAAKDKLASSALREERLNANRDEANDLDKMADLVVVQREAAAAQAAAQAAADAANEERVLRAKAARDEPGRGPAAVVTEITRLNNSTDGSKIFSIPDIGLKIECSIPEPWSRAAATSNIGIDWSAVEFINYSFTIPSGNYTGDELAKAATLASSVKEAWGTTAQQLFISTMAEAYGVSDPPTIVVNYIDEHFVFFSNMMYPFKNELPDPAMWWMTGVGTGAATVRMAHIVGGQEPQPTHVWIDDVDDVDHTSKKQTLDPSSLPSPFEIDIFDLDGAQAASLGVAAIAFEHWLEKRGVWGTERGAGRGAPRGAPPRAESSPDPETLRVVRHDVMGWVWAPERNLSWTGQSGILLDWLDQYRGTPGPRGAGIRSNKEDLIDLLENDDSPYYKSIYGKEWNQLTNYERLALVNEQPLNPEWNQLTNDERLALVDEQPLNPFTDENFTNISNGNSDKHNTLILQISCLILYIFLNVVHYMSLLMLSI